MNLEDLAPTSELQNIQNYWEIPMFCLKFHLSSSQNFQFPPLPPLSQYNVSEKLQTVSYNWEKFNHKFYKFEFIVILKYPVIKAFFFL